MRLERDFLLVLILLLPSLLDSTRLVVVLLVLVLMLTEGKCVSLNQQEAVLRLNAQVLNTREHEVVKRDGKR